MGRADGHHRCNRRHDLRWRNNRIPVTSTNTTTAGIRYTWTVTSNGNITGESASAGNGNDISVPLAQTLDNTSADKQMVTYTLTPWTIDENGNNACPGTPIDVDVWVEPTARMSVAPKQDTICNGAPVNITLTSPTVPTRDVKFRYVTEAPASVTVTPATGGPLDNNAVLVNTITNTSDSGTAGEVYHHPLYP